MHANVGDRIIIKGHNVGQPDRDAEILEVRGPEGTAPFVVRWSDSGHETLFYPGSDALVQRLGEETAPEAGQATVGELVHEEHRHLWAHTQQLLDAADALDGAEMVPDLVHDSYAFLHDHVLPHAKAEDQTIYEVVDELLGGKGATGPMRRQHVEIERLVDRLGRLRDDSAAGLDGPSRRNLRQVLHALHALLTVHLATEDELYLPLLESKLSPRRSRELAEAVAAAEAEVEHHDVALPT